MASFFSNRSKKTSFKKSPLTGGPLAHGIFSGVLISLIISITIQLIPAPTSAADAQFNVKDLAKIQAKLGNQSLSNMSSLYHQTVNDIVNAYIGTFMNSTNPVAEKKAIIVPPQDVADCATVGPTMNVSTFCLFMRLDGFYRAYASALQGKKDTIMQEIAAIRTGANYQTAALTDSLTREQWIDREISASTTAMDTTLRAYSELLLQYPMHLEYQEMLKILVKYYDRLIDIRKKVDTYPARFQDVSTTSCT